MRERESDAVFEEHRSPSSWGGMEVAEYGRRYCLARASNGEYMEKDGRRDVELTQTREEQRGREGGKPPI